MEAHGISLTEFEAIVSNPLSTNFSRTTGRPIAFGFGDDGRMLACVYELENDFDVIPITAYEVDNG